MKFLTCLHVSAANKTSIRNLIVCACNTRFLCLNVNLICSVAATSTLDRRAAPLTTNACPWVLASLRYERDDVVTIGAAR